jgi:hypothetical protein
LRIYQIPADAQIRRAGGGDRASRTYIHPERAADELPRLKQALGKRGLEITILTTDILRADEPHAESMLRAAADLGIKRYRLGFHRYDLKRPILPQLAAYEPVFRDLAAMNREIGIAAVYQNHAGADFLGATIWDLHRLIKPGRRNRLRLRHPSRRGGGRRSLAGLLRPDEAAPWRGLRQGLPLGRA